MSLKLRNIIAMEDESYEEVPLEVAEGAVDEVEAVEAADEITEETETMDEFSTELDETVEDVEELQVTEETLETALEDPEYEGLDEVSAEMIGQRLRALSKRRGFDVDRLEGVFSKESFNSRTSGRRRKTEIALEGIKDAIVAMWERIKAAVKAVWQAIKDFWKKHISTLGRLLKALEKTKKRARDVNGSPDSSKEIKPSGSLQRAFYAANNGPVTTSLINTYIDRQRDAMNNGDNVFNSITGNGGVLILLKNAFDHYENSDKNYEKLPERYKSYVGIDDKDDYKKDNEKKAKGRLGDLMSSADKSKLAGTLDKVISSITNFGKEEEPLTNGWFPVVDKDPLSEENPTLDFKWDQREVKPSDKRQFQVGNKKEMMDTLDNAIKLIKETQRFGGNFDKISRDFDKDMNAINRAISELSDNSGSGQSDGQKALSSLMRLVNDCARLVPKINTKVIGLNVTCAKQLISFCNTSISNYKEY